MLNRLPDLSLGVVSKLLAPPDEHERMQTHTEIKLAATAKAQFSGRSGTLYNPKSLQTRPVLTSSVVLAACSHCRSFLVSDDRISKC